MSDKRVVSRKFGPEKLEAHDGCADFQVIVKELGRLFTLKAFATLEYSSLSFKHAQILKQWRSAVMA